jgi:hypothetical protein
MSMVQPLLRPRGRPWLHTWSNIPCPAQKETPCPLLQLSHPSLILTMRLRNVLLASVSLVTSVLGKALNAVILTVGTGATGIRFKTYIRVPRRHSHPEKNSKLSFC